MQFLGCRTPESPPDDITSTCEADRVRAARLMLLRFFRQPEEPAWSSWLLERLLESVMASPGGSVGDLLYALHEILGEPAVKLTQAVKYLINALVVKSFTESRASYDSVDFNRMIERTIEGATPARAYLALLVIPPDRLPASRTAAILKGLEGTPEFAEAREWLEDDPQDSGPDGLGGWGADGNREASRVGIEQADCGGTTPPDVDTTLFHVRSHREP